MCRPFRPPFRSCPDPALTRGAKHCRRFAPHLAWLINRWTPSSGRDTVMLRDRAPKARHFDLAGHLFELSAVPSVLVLSQPPTAAVPNPTFFKNLLRELSLLSWPSPVRIADLHSKGSMPAIDTYLLRAKTTAFGRATLEGSAVPASRFTARTRAKNPRGRGRHRYRH
jgi:hypothetical protein